VVVMLLVLGVTARAEGPLAAEQPEQIVRQALARYEVGDYEGVVQALRPLVDADAPGLSAADRVEALRTFGIASVLTGRRVAAEGAFVLLLRADPRTDLDPTLVRPEAATFFQEVRGRWRAELAAAYRKNHGKRYPILNLLPPAGQFQNRERRKGYTLLAAEVALLATNISTGVLLNQWEGPNHLFLGHEDTARALIPVNIASFALFLSVVAYGIVDGFVVGHKLTVSERLEERRLLLSAGGVGVRF
jgi:hypothetical protein